MAKVAKSWLYCLQRDHCLNTLQLHNNTEFHMITTKPANEPVSRLGLDLCKQNLVASACENLCCEWVSVKSVSVQKRMWRNILEVEMPCNWQLWMKHSATHLNIQSVDLTSLLTLSIRAGTFISYDYLEQYIYNKVCQAHSINNNRLTLVNLQCIHLKFRIY